MDAKESLNDGNTQEASTISELENQLLVVVLTQIGNRFTYQHG